MEELILASGSPRRKTLLTAAGLPFRTIVPDIDESLRDGLPPANRVIALAEDKMLAAAALAAEAEIEGVTMPRLVLAADTLVCLPTATESEIALGKPQGQDEAREMLNRLAGRAHIVRTGLALLDRIDGKRRTLRSDTEVRFAAMSEEEIDSYLESREWEDVAGAYRIQGLAACFIDRIEGSWTGIVGLPMRELYVILAQADYRFPFARMEVNAGP